MLQRRFRRSAPRTAPPVMPMAEWAAGTAMLLRLLLAPTLIDLLH